jgi:hypothetical protein
VFHFNKGHLTDETIPMWVIKTHGVTMYVNHVTADIPWSTKETPGNEKTKGSIKFKKCKLTIDPDNNATISRLGIADAFLKPPTRRAARILFGYGSAVHKSLSAGEYEHSKLKDVEGSCGSSFVICDILDEHELTVFALRFAGKFRILAPNEAYYQDYDKGQVIWERDEEDDDINDS